MAADALWTKITRITFALRWMGSQVLICESLVAESALELQNEAALLIGELWPKAVRVMCSIPPNWVCLTPIDFRSDFKSAYSRGRDAWIQLQTMLPPGRIVPVYVSKHAPAEVLADQIINHNGIRFYDFEVLSDKMRSNFYVGRAALLDTYWSFADVWNSLHASLRSNKKFARSVFTCLDGCNNFIYACKWHNDRDMVLFVVRCKHFSFSMADRLYSKLPIGVQHDKEVLLAFIAKNGLVLRHAPEILKQDEACVMAAVQQNGRALKYAPEQFKQSKDVVLAAVTTSGLALKNAADLLKGDKQVVMAAVRSCGLALKYAAPELQHDQDVIANCCY
jgi:hypothetical protein